MLESLNIAIFVGSALVLAAVFTSLVSFRFGAPLLLVFLVVGLLAGEEAQGRRGSRYGPIDLIVRAAVLDLAQ